MATRSAMPLTVRTMREDVAELSTQNKQVHETNSLARKVESWRPRPRTFESVSHRGDTAALVQERDVPFSLKGDTAIAPPMRSPHYHASRRIVTAVLIAGVALGLGFATVLLIAAVT